MRKIIITVAPTGPMLSKKEHPNVPLTPEEIAQTAYECYNEGAAIVHVHARDETGQNTQRAEVYKRIHELIRAKCNIVQHFTTGNVDDPEERIGSLDAQPDMASLNVASLMRTMGPYAGTCWANPRSQIEHYAEEMLKRNIKPEIEMYNNGNFNEMENLIEKGLIAKPYYINFVFNMPYQGTMRAVPENLFSMIRLLPKDSVFSVTCIGRDQPVFSTLSMCAGGNCRVGFEDNIYYSKGELAKSNAQLVARAARIARELGLEIATPDDAREILGIPPRKEGV